MEIFKDFILQYYVIVAVIASGLVQVIKTVTKKDIHGLWLVLLVMGMAVVLAFLHGVFVLNGGHISGTVVVTTLEQGLLCGMAAILGYDLVKNLVLKVSTGKTEVQ